MSTPITTVSPMPKPAMRGARSSTVVPHTAVTRKNVSTNSIIAACSGLMSGLTVAAP